MMLTLRRCASATVLILLAALSALAQKPELVVQTGHSDRVTSIAFNPDGQTLASGGWDQTVKLWERSSGRELRTIPAKTSSVTAVAFSPDGKTIANSCSEGEIRIWEVSSGRELLTLKGHSQVASAVAFSPDGKTLASASWDKTIKLWDSASGREVRAITDADQVRAIAFSPDGKTIASATGGDVYSLKTWEVSTGRQLQTFTGHTNWIYSVAFSRDGKLLASGSADRTVRLWDVDSGRELRTLSGNEHVINSVSFSPDGRTLASGSEDHLLKLWDVATGQLLRSLDGHSQGITSLAFSPDGRTIATSSADNTIKFWEVASVRSASTLESHSQGLNSVAFSSNGKTIAAGGKGFVKLWDVATGSELRNLPLNASFTRDVVFNPKGTILAGAFSDSVILWDVATGLEVRQFRSIELTPTSIAFSLDGKMLAEGTEEDVIKVWDVETGQELRSLPASAYHIAFSADATTLASSYNDLNIKLWDVRTGRELRTLTGHLYPATALAFGPDGKTLASGSSGGIRLWDVATGQALRTLDYPSAVTCISFNPDGKTLANGNTDGTVRLWDVTIGRELRTLSGHSGYVNSVAFSPNGQYLISGSSDATIRCWRADGEPLATLIAVDEKAWLAVTPDGLFDGSPIAWDRILWRFKNDTFNYAPVESFFADFYYPGLLTDIFAGKQPKAPSDISQKDRRQPRLTLTLPTSQAGRVARIRIDINQAPAGAEDLRLFRNGSLVKVWHGDVLKGQNTATFEASVPIVAGENRFTAYAFNRDNIKSSDATLTINGADRLKRKGIAYVLAVGVNQYANTQYNLKYAVADATDFAEETKLQQEKVNNYERVEVIALNDRDATKANILKTLSDLSAKIQPEDALVIFFAGHGTAQQNRFYLIPHDLGYTGSRTQLDSAGLASILSHSISDEEIERAVEGIDAGQMLLVIDACNSGQALEAEEKRRGPMNSKGLAQLAYEKGMYILTAAQSYQAAQEATRLGHGFLTYALVEEGLKTKAADKEPKDGQVLLREWLDFATERVPEMQQDELDQQKKQGRQLDRIKFADADSGNERSIQRPRVFYRRETETQPLVVARP